MEGLVVVLNGELFLCNTCECFFDNLAFCSSSVLCFCVLVGGLFFSGQRSTNGSCQLSAIAFVQIYNLIRQTCARRDLSCSLTGHTTFLFISSINVVVLLVGKILITLWCRSDPSCRARHFFATKKREISSNGNGNPLPRHDKLRYVAHTHKNDRPAIHTSHTAVNISRDQHTPERGEIAVHEFSIVVFLSEQTLSDSQNTNKHTEGQFSNNITQHIYIEKREHSE